MDSEISPRMAQAKPLMRVLAGEAVWPPPVWLMRQAGRYLPEFRAERARADFLTRCTTPDIATELTMQPIRRYGMDAAILFSDILVLPWAMGQDLRFIEGRGPVMEPIRNRQALAALSPDRVASVVAPIQETLRRLSTDLPASTTLLGFAGSPFTVACYMVEGGSSREFAVTRTMALQDPALFDDLIALLVRTTTDMLIGQIDAGADAVMLFDSWSGILPPSQFRRHVIAPTREIVAGIRAARPGTRIIGFPRLAGLMAIEYAEATGVDALACDTSVDMAALAKRVPDTLALQGNLDPVILRAGGQALTDEVRRIRNPLRGRPHVFNLGHGVMPDTSPDHVGQLVDAVRDPG
ncbi:uroporphyrinogen decarboxylase [Swaminathania salitolerans]|nr:uroporphyrinogen decarboxylase [Swaminathania salitolerans]